MTTTYDVIVVGGRCAGSSTALLLARLGHRVLVVDRAAFPSDTVSGHAIHPSGLATLQRWGLLDAVRAAGAPALTRQRFHAGPLVLAGTPAPIDGIDALICPRRTVLDEVMLREAEAAGADVWQGFSVKELLRDGDVVTGVRGRDESGRAVDVTAGVVVGADGKHSMVARAAGAETYQAVPALTCNAYSYFSGAAVDEVELYAMDGGFVVAVPTNDGLTIVNAVSPIAAAVDVRTAVEASFWDVVSRAGDLAERLRAGTRAERFRFTADLDNFFRRPWGPGWALVGDAGYHKDPITAQGMADAYRDAELLATALHAGLASEPMLGALAGYERARNAAAGPMYDFTLDLARLAPPPPDFVALLAALAGNPAGIAAFLGVIAGSTPIPEFFSDDNLTRLLAS